MSIMTIINSWLFADQAPENHVETDAAALMELWGDAAPTVAADLSWREDIGLLRSQDPGHWGRVHLEIGRRMGLAEGPTLDLRLAA